LLFADCSFSKNYLYQTTDGKKLCELNNGGEDEMFFALDTFVSKPDPSLFSLPPGGCSKACGGDKFPCSQTPPAPGMW
jgi:hypothetical protein